MWLSHLAIPVLMLFSDPLTGSISASLNTSSLTCLLFSQIYLHLDPISKSHAGGMWCYIGSLAPAYLIMIVFRGGGEKRHESFGYLYVHRRNNNFDSNMTIEYHN